MAKRDDGKETRKRLLKAALQLFSQKGYTQVTISDICKKAGANQASVNYYFGDKAGLYAESWEYAIDQLPDYLSESNPNAGPEGQLTDFIRSLLDDFLKEDEQGAFVRLYLLELLQPTGILIQHAWHEKIQPRREKLQQIICRIIGGEPDIETLVFCELSIVSQCRHLLTIKPDDREFFMGYEMNQATIDRLADHIAKFSLAGIKAFSIEASSPRP